jgi:hypothetical protein
MKTRLVLKSRPERQEKRNPEKIFVNWEEVASKTSCQKSASNTAPLINAIASKPLTIWTVNRYHSPPLPDRTQAY